MPSFSAVCQRILNGPDSRLRLLTGGLLSMVPIANILALGYLVQYGRRILGGRPDLPPWRDLASLARDGLVGLLLQLVWVGVPAVLGAAVMIVLREVFAFLLFWTPPFHAVAQTIAWLPLVLSVAVGVPLSILSLLRYSATGSIPKALDLRAIPAALRDHMGVLLVPTLACYGIVAIAWPLYGFAFFIAMTLLVAYYSLAVEG